MRHRELDSLASRHVSIATVVGGTGRVANTLTIRYVAEIDFALGRSAGSGSIDGRIVPR
jgi:hypothetical protein